MTDRVFVRHLGLNHFRNYQHLSLSLDAQHCVFFGANGAGKTNLLEAISLFSPGRGMRRANYQDMSFAGSEQGFAINLRLESPYYGDVDIGTGLYGQKSQETGRKIRIQGEPAHSEDLLDYARIIWLLPSQDGLFVAAAAERRRFVDRMVLAIDPAHGRRVAAYEKAMRSRNRLLSQASYDATWMDAIEVQLAELGVAIAAARMQLIASLRAMIDEMPDGGAFPQADLVLDGWVDQQLMSMAASDVEMQLRQLLHEGRGRDKLSGRTLDGPHRSDLIVSHRPKSLLASMCSTGEQKALLTGIILAHARLTARLSGMTPILLLDEIAAHLDADRRAALFDIINDLGAQSFMTGTDDSLFSAIRDRAQFFRVNQAQLESV